MVKCIECKKQVDENDGLQWADGFVCTPCLYNASSWAEPSLYNYMSNTDRYVAEMERIETDHHAWAIRFIEMAKHQDEHGDGPPF